MSRKQYVLLLAVVAIMGLLGGGLVQISLPRATAQAAAEKGNEEAPFPRGYTRVVTTQFLQIVDENMKRQAFLGYEADRIRLTLFDAEGRGAIEMSVKKQGERFIRFYDPSGLPRLSLVLDKAVPSLAVANTQGVCAAALRADKDKTAIRFYGPQDKAGSVQPLLGLGNIGGKGALVFFDNAGKPVWMAP